MPHEWRMPSTEVPLCPHCQGALSVVASWDFCGLWGYYEMRTYECPQHGPIFISPQIADAPGSNRRPDADSEQADRDSLISAPRKPRPTLDDDGDDRHS